VEVIEEAVEAVEASVEEEVAVVVASEIWDLPAK
jgi:hypothetical protein